MIGLDGAGKTTALYRLKFDQYMNTVPTVGFNCERVKGSLGRSRGLTFLVWDVGGQVGYIQLIYPHLLLW